MSGLSVILRHVRENVLPEPFPGDRTCRKALHAVKESLFLVGSKPRAIDSHGCDASKMHHDFFAEQCGTC